MNISFDTRDFREENARGLVAMLISIYGNNILPGNVVTTAPTVRAVEVRSSTAGTTVTPIIDTATDGEPNAAAAFGGSQAEPYEEPSAAAVFGGASASTPAPAVTGGVELDKRGIPWDERIHSSTKAITGKGEWQRRRNTPDETFDAVMGELKARMSGQSVASQSQTTTAVPPPPPPSASVATTAAPAPSQTVAAPAASSTAPAGTGELISFPQIMIKTMGLQREGKITPDGVKNLLKSCGAIDMGGLKDDYKRFAFNMLLDDPANHTGA